MAITADQIGINPSLTSALGAIGTPYQGSISDVYAKKKSQLMADARPGAATMFAPGSYASDRMSTGENLSQGNLKSGLEQVLGNTSYGDWKSQRDYEQNMQLAKLTAELNKPDTLSQVLGALAGGARVAGQVYGATRGMGGGTPYMPTSTPNYGYYNSGGSGLNMYG